MRDSSLDLVIHKWCLAHRSSLLLGDCLTAMPRWEQVKGTICSVVSFLKDTRSPRRVHALRTAITELRHNEAEEVEQEELDLDTVLGVLDVGGGYMSLLTYTPIRWLSLFQCVSRLVASWKAIEQVLLDDKIYEASTPKVRRKASMFAGSY